MADKVMPGPVSDQCGIREAVCIHTRKIYDSCRDKDCIEDLRFYPKLQCVDVIDRALSVKGGSAKLLYVYVDVEPVSFNRGFYTVDMRFFYNVTLQAYLSCPAPVSVEGLCVFDKRVILFGSEGNAKIFSSELRTGKPDIQMMRRTNLPVAVVEAVDPIVLDARSLDPVWSAGYGAALPPLHRTSPIRKSGWDFTYPLFYSYHPSVFQRYIRSCSEIYSLFSTYFSFQRGSVKNIYSLFLKKY